MEFESEEQRLLVQQCLAARCNYTTRFHKMSPALQNHLVAQGLVEPLQPPPLPPSFPGDPAQDMFAEPMNYAPGGQASAAAFDAYTRGKYPGMINPHTADGIPCDPWYGGRFVPLHDMDYGTPAVPHPTDARYTRNCAKPWQRF